MSTEVPNELDAFRHFVDQQVVGGSVSSVDELWAKYQKCRDEIRRLRTEILESAAQADAGQAQPLDLDALDERVLRRLTDQGMTD